MASWLLNIGEASGISLKPRRQDKRHIYHWQCLFQLAGDDATLWERKIQCNAVNPQEDSCRHPPFPSAITSKVLNSRVLFSL